MESLKVCQCVKNFKQFAEEVSAEIRGAGPCLTEE